MNKVSSPPKPGNHHNSHIIPGGPVEILTEQEMSECQKVVTFSVPIEPFRATAQQKGAVAQPKTAVFLPGRGSSGRVLSSSRGRPAVRFFHKENYRAAEQELIARLRRTFDRGSEFAKGVPVRVSLRLIWPYKARTPKRVTESELLIRMTSRPDLDNLAKLYLDVLPKVGFLHDDNQIADLRLSKFWGPPGVVGIHYTIETLESEVPR